jgi:hypothetical protein
MRPAPGRRFRLKSHPTGTPPRQYDMLVEVFEWGYRATFGDLHFVSNDPASPSYDLARHPKADVSIRCTGNGTFVAIVKAGEPDEETYSGTCEEEVDEDE